MRRRPRFRLLLLLTVEAGVLETLRRIGTRLPLSGTDPLGWIRVAPAEDVIVVAAWLTALAVAAWLALTTVAYLGTRLAGLSRAGTVVHRLTAPVIRRLVEGAVVLSLATSVAAAPSIPAVATELPPPLVLQLADDAAPDTASPADLVVPEAAPTLTVLPPGMTAAGFAPVAGNAPAPDPAPESLPPSPEPAAEERHTVAPGDNLWTIARNHLRGRGAEADAASDVARYWREVISANRATLRSGDPNLIYPGEIVTLPPIGPAS